MRINILTSVGTKPGGINRVLLEYANHLTLRGHKVKVIKPLDMRRNKQDIQARMKQFVFFGFWPRLRLYRCVWMRCLAELYVVPFCHDKYIPDADITIFSSLKVLKLVSTLDKKKGKKIFINQDPHVDPKELFIPKDMTFVVISSYLKNIFENYFKERDILILENGINLDLFCNPKKTFSSAKTVGMIFYNKKPIRKGMEDGILAFNSVRKKYPHLKLLMAGLKRESWIPDHVCFFKGVDHKKLVDFYSKTDIFLFPSHLESCGLPFMEAMACQCAVVASNVGAVPDCSVPGETILVSQPRDVEGLIKNLTFLIERPDRLKEIALAGYDYIKRFSWQRQTLKLEKIMESLL